MSASTGLWRHRHGHRPRSGSSQHPPDSPSTVTTASVARSGYGAPHRSRRRITTPGLAIAWLLVIATLLICVAAGPRIRIRSIERSAAFLKRDGGDGGAEEHGAGSLLRIPYDKVYKSCPPALQPFFVAALVLIIIFLFCTISITASDFFCPNLATLAAYLGLSETTAGVTLLAFGNGSPDVFSTFVSVRQGTLGLAVGELIGAATFITSIVVGCIALVKPFHVPKFAFLRDVSFFTTAVLVLMSVLADGKLTLRESGGMIALYGLYVAVVVVGSWWSTRRRRRETFADLGWKTHDEESSPDGVELDVEDLGDPSESMTLTEPHIRRRQSIASRLTYDDGPTEEEMADTQRPAWSLLGAVEFRDAVNALKREGITPTSSAGNSRPVSPVGTYDESYFDQRHHRRASSQGLNVGYESSLRRGGRSRSSSLVAGWLSRARAEQDGETQLSSMASPPLEVVPGSPRSGGTGGSGTDSTPIHHILPEHPADESLPLASLNPRRSRAAPTDDEPLTLRVDTSPRTLRVGTSGVPAIAVVDPEGEVEPPILALSRTNTTATIVHVCRTTFHRVLHTLFPSLQGFWKKSLAGMILAVFSTPALLALTITLPVVDDGRGDEGGIELPGPEDETLGPEEEEEEEEEELANNSLALPRSPQCPTSPVSARHAVSPASPVSALVSHELHHLVENGGVLPRPRHLPESSTIVRSGASCPPSDDGMDDDECVLEFSPVLTAAQCIFGPLVCTWLLFQDESYVVWTLLAALVAGSAAAALVLRFADDGTSQPWRLVRCCAGFVCSMVWIATIADEVVAVLQTFGEIFGLSDAIIGLTIFAVGNSLADLVANVTIAQFAPNMAYAACFGGPMLNLLLGIGGSGSWSILTKPEHAPVHIDFSPTLWVSGTGLVLILVTTALIVPLSRFFIDRRWAMCLLAGYASLMTINVIVEIRSERRPKNGQ